MSEWSSVPNILEPIGYSAGKLHDLLAFLICKNSCMFTLADHIGKRDRRGMGVHIDNQR